MMMNNLGKLMVNSVFLLLFLISAPVLAKVKAYLNQSNFYEGDVIPLMIETSTNSKAKPNLENLESKFKVIGTSTSSQIYIVNGKRSFKKTWTIELQPKLMGEIHIPSITIGNEKTEPLNIQVTALPPEVKAETEKHVFIETTVGIADNETYVQQQIPYTVKLYFDSAMQSGEINSPNVENAVVEELIENKRYTVMKKGKEFNVVEKHFTISPEKSGTLVIPATTVSGRLALSGGDSSKLRQRMDETDMLNQFFSNFRNDPFFNDTFNDDFFSRHSRGPSKPFTAKSQEITVNVLPVPDSFTGAAWLPAESLSIKDSWSSNPPELKVGEPVTRTLILKAKGLGGSQIPKIEIPKPDGIKIYTEQPESKTHTDGRTLYGTQYLSMTYIPSHEGKATIPELKVDWWNVKTKKQQTFTLPAWNLNIAPGVEVPNTSEESATQKPIDTLSNTDDKSSVIADTEKNVEQASSWNWMSLGLGGIIILLAAAAFFWIFKQAKNRSVRLEKNKEKQPDLSVIRSSLINACDSNNKQAAANALINYTQTKWNDHSIQNLGSIASRLNKGADVIAVLEHSLYAVEKSEWQGNQLKELILKGLEQKQQDTLSNKQGLAPLYPL